MIRVQSKFYTVKSTFHPFQYLKLAHKRAFLGMFGIETTLYQGFYFLYITKLYNVPHFAAIPAEPHLPPQP